MKEHSGMRPQDIVILLKVVSKPDKNWYLKDIANELGISASEVSESLNRSKIAGLVDETGRQVRKLALMDFLIHGLKYVFPQKPRHFTRGMPTAHSAPPLNKMIRSEHTYVWPAAEGNSAGFAIEPLYKTVVKAAENDTKFYKLMSLVEAIRVGKTRENKLAQKELQKLLNGNQK